MHINVYMKLITLYADEKSIKRIKIMHKQLNNRRFWNWEGMHYDLIHIRNHIY